MILLEFVLDIFDHDPYHSNDGNDEGSKCESAKMVSTNSKNIFDQVTSDKTYDMHNPV